MLSYQKHTITCRCILNQHKNIENPPSFSFIVLSVMSNNNIVEKFVKCSNCGIIHQVYELCKSKILDNQTENAITIDDIKRVLPEKISFILDDYSCELHVYEEAKFIVDNNEWHKKLILTREFINSESNSYYEGKLLKFNNAHSYEIEYWKSTY